MGPEGGLGRRARAIYERFFGSHRQRLLTLMLLLFVLDFADRTLVGALGPTIKHTFSIDNFQFGLLSAAFVLVGAGATIPIGMLTDRVSRTMVIAIGLVLWTIAVALVGASVSFAMLFVSRLFLGVVAATSGPTVPSLVGDITPAGERAKAMGSVDVGQLIGTGLGFLLPVIITAFVSWRFAFWLLAVWGAFLALAFWRVGEPQRTKGTGPGEEKGQESDVQKAVREAGVKPNPLAIVTKPPEQMSMWEATRYVVRVRTDLIVLVTRSFGDYFLAAISAFAVVFATQWYKISQSEANIAILVLGIGALLGVLLLGRFADRMLVRGHPRSRVLLGAAGYLVAPIIFFPAFLTHSIFLAVVLFTLGAFCLAGSIPTLDAVRIDVVIPRLRGRAESIRRVFRTVAEGSAPLATGFLAQHLLGGGVEGLRAAFLIALPSVFIAGVVLLIALRTYEPDVAAALESSQKVAEGKQR